MSRVKVKICGITNLDDALFAAQLGVDALGFNFYPNSPRYIEASVAADIISRLPPFLTTVGLFVNAREDQVREHVAVSGVSLIQFHGDEDDQFCRSFAYPYLKVLRVNPQTDIKGLSARYPFAAGILLDTYVSDAYGGTGAVFDWTRVPQDLGKPVILAGGLTASNVTPAIQLTRPYAVDVSSGVEAVRGKKDEQKMIDFVNAVKGCD